MMRQKFRSVVIDLGESHGMQLYFAMSLARNSDTMKVFVKQTSSQGPMLHDGGDLTGDIIYTEIFCD
jgi:hypothetical protein